MDKKAIKDALSYSKHGLLATITNNGAIHSVLVNPFWESRLETIAVFSRRRSQKIVNLLARPAATLTIVEGPKYFAMIGTASVSDDPEVVAACYDSFAVKYDRIPAQALDRVVIFLTVQRTLGLPLRNLEAEGQ